MKAHIPEKYGVKDDADARIRELEVLIGLTESPNIECVDHAWDRIELLEKLIEAYPKNQPPDRSVALSAAHPSPPYLSNNSPTSLTRAGSANRSSKARNEPSSSPIPFNGSSHLSNGPLTGLARAIAANQSKTSKIHRQ